MVAAAARAVSLADQLGEQLGVSDGAAVAFLAPRRRPHVAALYHHAGREVIEHGSFSER
jgi:hypothetical protein